jgi:hypothetical protein
MTDLQLYLIIAPLVIAAIGVGAAFWWVRQDRF